MVEVSEMELELNTINDNEIYFPVDTFIFEEKEEAILFSESLKLSLPTQNRKTETIQQNPKRFLHSKPNLPPKLVTHNSNIDTTPMDEIIQENKRLQQKLSQIQNYKPKEQDIQQIKKTQEEINHLKKLKKKWKKITKFSNPTTGKNFSLVELFQNLNIDPSTVDYIEEENDFLTN